MLDLEQLTADVCRIATAAGHFLKEERKNFRRESVIEKCTHDYVSYVDKESERRLVTELSALLPEAGFIAEEGSATYNDEPYCWVIDPLDGTTNYIHDNAPYCFYAWKGGKAWLNGEPLHISDIDDVTNAFLIVELPYNDAAYKQIAMHLLDDLYGKAGAIRMNGSAAAAICYVAAGRFDGWLEAFIGKWDYSAAALIVLEAGGEVTDFYGSRDFMEGHHIIATNGHLHAYLQDLVKEVRF